MKKIALLILSLLISSLSFSKSTKIPKQLQGFWQYKVNNLSNWNGPIIGETYVDFQYSIYLVDSVTSIANGYKIWLTANKSKLNLTITNLKEGKASIFFNTWKKPEDATLFDKDPDVKFYGRNETPAQYSKQWVIPTAKPSFFSISKNKVNYLEKKWDLVWIGRYLNLEDRVLIKNNNEYKILYLRNKGSNLSIASQRVNQTYSPIATNPSIYKILGNWINQDSNAWEYGFYENYAIHDSKLWKYKSLTFGKETIAELSNGNDHKSVKISLLNDSTSLISVNSTKQTYYRQTGKFRDNKSIDNKTFYDSEFKKIDTAIITGIIRNASNKNAFSVTVENHLLGKEEKYFGDLDSNNFFTVKVPLLNTSQVFLDWGRINGTDVIEPGEHYFYFADQATDFKATMGSNSTFHNELVNYKINGPFSTILGRYESLRKMKLVDFLAEKVKDHQKSLAIIKKYYEENPNLSNRFKYFVSENAKYNLGFDLMQKRFDLNRQNRERFPDGYMQYVNDSLYQNQPPKPVTLVRDFKTFITDYYGYYAEQKENSVSNQVVLFDLVEKGKITTNNEEKKALTAQKAFLDYSRNVKDSIYFAKIFEAFTPAYRKLAEEVYIRNQALVTKRANYVHQLKGIEKEYESIATAKNEALENLLYTKTLFKLYERQHQAMVESDLKNFTDKITNPLFVSLVNDKQTFYKNLVTVDLTYAESLKRTDHLISAKSADSLWAALTKPYLGKVIYVDFWGTWCGPCRGEMPFVANVKKELKGKNVVFMYFANNSPKESWENMIKEYSLTGENIVQYNLPHQLQNMLETRMSINSFPTYIIIDKDGNVKTMNAPRPSDKENLVKTINSLL